MTNKYVQALILRFPALGPVITQLHHDDPDFQSICEEMEIADLARERWRDLPSRAEEYQLIMERLEKELLDVTNRSIG